VYTTGGNYNIYFILKLLKFLAKYKHLDYLSITEKRKPKKNSTYDGLDWFMDDFNLDKDQGMCRYNKLSKNIYNKNEFGFKNPKPI